MKKKTIKISLLTFVIIFVVIALSIISYFIYEFYKVKDIKLEGIYAFEDSDIGYEFDKEGHWIQ